MNGFIAGQRVQYNRGGVRHMLGNYGVVVDAGNRQTIPSGLTYVRFDGRVAPMIVATDGLDDAVLGHNTWSWGCKVPNDEKPNGDALDAQAVCSICEGGA
jgi:hypothetical protein